MSFKKWLRGGKDEEPENSADKEDQGTPSVQENTPPSPPADIPSVPISLEDITRGMQYAATAANELIAQQYMKALDPFFEPAEDGSLIPRTVQLALDEKHYFDLPLVALSTPRGLMLEKMKVNLTIRTEGMQAPSRQSGENEFGRFHVSLSPSSDNKGGRDSRHVDVEMQFTALEPPESVMRLIDEYTNKVIPRPKAEETP
ncbi:DUF2589 domain-containing protein [Enterobacter sp. DNB-S2]|jgi:hypothetical protein|uniref:DUF2589 domain-containing protein n=1 Tax=Enterobacter sp. DNB-S2 TaxID=2720029 RepID=UPI001C633FD3|nr:DUF2589 domain-containing protein [Enterobacter sp. DNB-S2]QYH15410.1 DUF2589 domain-containing protein [Enterobacter sp. DNB-S2]